MNEKNQYELLMLEYYEKFHNADRIKVINNNNIFKSTEVLFYKKYARSGLINSPIPNQETVIFLFDYLKENEIYKIKTVKEIIKNGKKNDS